MSLRVVESELLLDDAVLRDATTELEHGFVQTRLQVEFDADDGDAADDGGDNDNDNDGDDSDGDLVVRRRQARRRVWNVLWKRQSDVDAVGVQLWQGALLMCDFVLQPQSPVGSRSRSRARRR